MRTGAEGHEVAPQRLFVAVRIPAEATESLDVAIESWRGALPKARWVPVRNWHVTLAFLGSTDPSLVSWVHEQLATVADATPPFETRVRGLGSFPSVRRARVLWAGLDDASGAMSSLASTVRYALAGRFPLEVRAFTAHLTIARCEPSVTLPAAFSETPLESAPFTVEALALMRSHLARPAPHYEIVTGFPLTGARHESP